MHTTFKPIKHWEWLFQSWLTVAMWTESYYEFLSTIGDDYE